MISFDCCWRFYYCILDLIQFSFFFLRKSDFPPFYRGQNYRRSQTIGSKLLQMHANFMNKIDRKVNQFGYWFNLKTLTRKKNVIIHWAIFQQLHVLLPLQFSISVFILFINEMEEWWIDAKILYRCIVYKIYWFGLQFGMA